MVAETAAVERHKARSYARRQRYRVLRERGTASLHPRMGCISQARRTLHEGPSPSPRGVVRHGINHKSGICSILAACIIALLGPYLLSQRFKSLEDAANSVKLTTIDLTEKINNLAQSVKERIEALTTTVEDRVSKLDIQIASLERTLGTLQNIVNDIAEDLEAAEEVVVVQPNAEAKNRREQLRAKWNEIRDRVEDIASSPEIDGRTRAKYSRIDRRNYGKLLEALKDDGNLGENAERFLNAYRIWSRYRANRKVVTDEDLNALS